MKHSLAHNFFMTNLVVPGMESRNERKDPSLPNLASLSSSSPSVGGTTRARRNQIPGTPSPTYGYEPRYNRMMPRFFPFVVEDLNPNDDRSTQPGLTLPIRKLSQTPEVVAAPIIAAPVVYSPAPVTSPLVQTPSREETLLSRIRSSAPPALHEILPDAQSFATDQFGSRFLQQTIESASAAETHKLFVSLLPVVARLSTDAFGNYVVQKLLEYLPLEHRVLLGEQLLGQVLTLATHTYGCRVIQKIMDSVGGPRGKTLQSDSYSGDAGRSLLRLLVSELKGSVIQCVEDQNGNHVVQKSIERLALQDVLFIVEEVFSAAERLSLHCYGCRVLQRLLEKLPPTGVHAKTLSTELVRVGRSLAFDQYGNYVIQHLLAFGSPETKDTISKMVAHSVVEFSSHKFASNVAERALVCSTPNGRVKIISAILGDQSGCPLLVLTKDRFANYVVQRCVELSAGEQRTRVLALLRGQLPSLKKVVYGKHIATAVESAIP